jgi:hypothetical protein
MASSSKKKTTFAKLNREAKLRERRAEKQARKDARKHEASQRRLEEEQAATAPVLEQDRETAES